jgi:hypothetical protein
MGSTYHNCTNLTGNPVCGNNVTDMSLAYADCINLTGNPVCGNNVTGMSLAYDNCYNLTGNPVCGNNVTNMYRTYANCYNLTGNPVCGNNVTNMSSTYENCTNLSSNVYFYSNKISNVWNCFYGKNNFNRLNIYVHNNTTSLNTLLITNSYSLVGNTIAWTNDVATNGYHYNTDYNIYIYPVANVKMAHLENESDTSVAFTNNVNTQINIMNNNVTVKTEWEFTPTELTIDSGRCFAIGINTSSLSDVTIESMGVK